jgi:anti-sigma factor RsiW
MTTGPTCASGVDLLAEYLEDQVSPEVRADLEAHVAGCPRCRAFVRAYRETPRIMRQATLAAFPADLEQSLREFLRRQRG